MGAEEAVGEKVDVLERSAPGFGMQRIAVILFQDVALDERSPYMVWRGFPPIPYEHVDIRVGFGIIGIGIEHGIIRFLRGNLRSGEIQEENKERENGTGHKNPPF
jgi:hypothetical protein